MSTMTAHARGAAGPPVTGGAKWYRMPVFWLAVLMFVASLAGCIITIMIALGQPSDALGDDGERIFKVPTSHLPEAPQ